MEPDVSSNKMQGQRGSGFSANSISSNLGSSDMGSPWFKMSLNYRTFWEKVEGRQKMLKS